MSTLKYFEPGLDADSHGPGHMVLRVLLILAEGPESVVDMVMNENVCNTLIQCLSLFLELPATGGSHDSHVMMWKLVGLFVVGKVLFTES